MFRRDYIIDQIEEFAEMLAAILGLTKASDWAKASEVAEKEVHTLLGVDLAEALKLSETELFARLVQNGPTPIAERRVFMLAQLFRAAGEIAAGQGKDAEGREYILKGLDLILDKLDLTAIGARPDFVPMVESLVLALKEEPLPARTLALLMRHYERTGEFARAEDTLFAIVDAQGPSPELLELGEGFYRRLATQSQAALRKGNLLPEETQAGLEDFRNRLRVK